MVMTRHLPGTILPLGETPPNRAFSVLEPILTVSGGGLLLSQLGEMTGLGGSTIQNWVKRGWVSRPEGKRYGPVQVARILLINLLRPAMQLEKIADVLALVNGRVDDRTDDIIPEPELYNLLCADLFAMDEANRFHHEFVIALIDAQLEGYEEPVAGAKNRLREALTLMLLNIAAGELMQMAEDMYQQLAAAAPVPAPEGH